MQTLIEAGKINFKSSHQSSNLSLNFSGARIEEVEEFVTIIGRVQERRTGCTTEKPEEEKKASKLQKENEKLRHLIQDMAHMMTEQKESIATLRRGI